MPAALVAVPLLAVALFLFAFAATHSTHAWALPQFHTGNGLQKILTAPLNAIIGAGNAIVSAMVSLLNQIVTDHVSPMVDLFNGITWSWNAYFEQAQAHAKSIHDTLDHAFNVALPAAFADARGYVDTKTGAVASALDTYKATVREDLRTAAKDTTNAIARAVTSTENYADSSATTAYTNAVAYIDARVSDLHDSLTATLDTVSTLANTAEHDAQAAISQAGAIAADIGAPVGQSLADFERYVQSLSLPALIASVPAVALLVDTIARETGLSNAECRAKVKGICGTSPSAWAGLLAGIAAAGIALDFRDVIHLAVELEQGAAGALGKLASLDDAAANDAAHVIADAMLALAG